VALSSGGQCRNSAAAVVEMTSFPFPSVLRSWVGKAEGLISVVIRLQWLQISVMPSGKDRQGMTSSGL
jgi:hypothetical protein